MPHKLFAGHDEHSFEGHGKQFNTPESGESSCNDSQPCSSTRYQNFLASGKASMHQGNKFNKEKITNNGMSRANEHATRYPFVKSDNQKQQQMYKAYRKNEDAHAQTKQRRGRATPDTSYASPSSEARTQRSIRITELARGRAGRRNTRRGELITTASL